jgi:hypothetical protein
MNSFFKFNVLLIKVKFGAISPFISNPELYGFRRIFFPEPPQPKFLNVYGAQESIPRNELRQPV